MIYRIVRKMYLERIALVLEIIGQKGRATVADICSQSDLPKPTAYRLVQELVTSGLLETPARGVFAIGARLKRITLSDYSDAALLEVIAPVLSSAADAYGAAFFFLACAVTGLRSFTLQHRKRVFLTSIPVWASVRYTRVPAPRPSPPCRPIF